MCAGVSNLLSRTKKHTRIPPQKLKLQISVLEWKSCIFRVTFLTVKINNLEKWANQENLNFPKNLFRHSAIHIRLI